ncbi:hypothetical protein, partial [uncultured Desulfovibrio sp.]|uniref:hypothetical protein n=1 Tax=uncultured Desulfovibrio sp. TaxID=167968 RepID=UPI002670520A
DHFHYKDTLKRQFFWPIQNTTGLIFYFTAPLCQQTDAEHAHVENSLCAAPHCRNSSHNNDDISEKDALNKEGDEGSHEAADKTDAGFFIDSCYDAVAGRGFLLPDWNNEPAFHRGRVY